MQRWYVVQSEPGRETMALAHLDRQGFGAFLPIEAVWRVYRGEGYWHHLPYFAGYLFVEFDACASEWCGIKELPGCRGVLTYCDTLQPKPVPEEAMNWLLSHAGEAGVIRERDGRPTVPNWIRGQLFGVVDGPFTNFEATFERFLNDPAPKPKRRRKGQKLREQAAFRAEVFVSIFGRQTRVELELGQLEPVVA